MLRDCVPHLVDDVNAVIYAMVFQSAGVSRNVVADRTDYDEMSRARAGWFVNGALNCPCISLLPKAPNLIRTKVGDEHFVSEWHNLERKTRLSAWYMRDRIGKLFPLGAHVSSVGWAVDQSP